jgi:poly(U)-binding-splicing factor PUF60
MYMNLNFNEIFTEADKACSSLNGRYFGGRLVKAESYDQALFDHEDYSG